MNSRRIPLTDIDALILGVRNVAMNGHFSFDFEDQRAADESADARVLTPARSKAEAALEADHPF